MTFTNDERREVAARLRAVETLEYDGDEWCDKGDVLDALGVYNNDDPNSCDPDKVAFLADLIDRPTCKNVSDFGSHMVTVRNFSKNEYFDFVCDRCGTYLKSDEMEFSPLRDENCKRRALHFCPYCGAEVVE